MGLEREDTIMDSGAAPVDAELAAQALSYDAATWRELVRRFTPAIRWQLGRTLASGKRVLCSDSVDEALAEYWIALLKDDCAWLRRFDAARGHALGNWLNVLAWDVASKHLRRHYRWRACRSTADLDEDRAASSGRGARFLAMMARIEAEEPPKKRRFKWR